MRQTLRQGALGVAGLLTLFALWWLGVALFGAADGLSARFSPQATLLSLGELLERRELYEHVLVSLKRVLLGLFLALLVGVPLGLLVGASRNLEAATTPAFQFLRMISPLSWMPIAVMLMGVGDQPIYFLLAFAALWPILLNTAAGVRQLDPRWLQLSRSKIEVCLAMCDRAFGQIEVPDENARVPALDILLRAGMGFLRQCCEPGSVQRVLEILYLKCERSDENEPLLRRRELLEKQGQRFGLRQIRRAVERGELPARLDVELASIYLQSLWDGICGTLAWTERLRDDPWNRAERMFRAGLDSLRSSPYLLLADA